AVAFSSPSRQVAAPRVGIHGSPRSVFVTSAARTCSALSTDDSAEPVGLGCSAAGDAAEAGVEAGAEAADRAAAPSSAEQAVAVSRAVTDRAETRTARAAGARVIGLSPGGPVRSRTPAPTAPPPRPPHQCDGPSG